jgi:uncharacterized membrane protein YhaH (DUF805 family)
MSGRRERQPTWGDLLMRGREKGNRRMAASIGLWEHFRKLASFKGREDRASFWPYAALVLGIVMVAGAVMAIPLMTESMRAATAGAAPQPFEVPDGIDLNEFSMSAPAAVGGAVPSAAFLAAYLGVTFGLAILLYAAAVVRRLHDRGKSGAWALMPLPFILHQSIQVPRMFGSTAQGGQPESGLLLSLALSNLFYLATLLTLVVLLAGASDAGPNRYDVES